MLTAISWQDINQFLVFLKSLESKKLVTIKKPKSDPTVDKNGLDPSRNKCRLVFNEQAAQEFLLANDGNTYLLSDILALDEKSILALSHLKFPVKKGQRWYSVQDIIANKNAIAALDLVTNEPLLKALSEIIFRTKAKIKNVSKLTSKHISPSTLLADLPREKCVITRDKVILPAVNLVSNQQYEYNAILLHMMKTNLLNGEKDPITFEHTHIHQVLPNRALADLYWLEFLQNCNRHKLAANKSATNNTDYLKKFSEESELIAQLLSQQTELLNKTVSRFECKESIEELETKRKQLHDEFESKYGKISDTKIEEFTTAKIATLSSQLEKLKAINPQRRIFRTAFIAGIFMLAATLTLGLLFPPFFIPVLLTCLSIYLASFMFNMVNWIKIEHKQKKLTKEISALEATAKTANEYGLLAENKKMATHLNVNTTINYSERYKALAGEAKSLLKANSDQAENSQDNAWQKQAQSPKLSASPDKFLSSNSPSLENDELNNLGPNLGNQTR